MRKSEISLVSPMNSIQIEKRQVSSLKRPRPQTSWPQVETEPSSSYFEAYECQKCHDIHKKGTTCQTFEAYQCSLCGGIHKKGIVCSLAAAKNQKARMTNRYENNSNSVNETADVSANQGGSAESEPYQKEPLNLVYKKASHSEIVKLLHEPKKNVTISPSQRPCQQVNTTKKKLRVLLPGPSQGSADINDRTNQASTRSANFEKQPIKFVVENHEIDRGDLPEKDIEIIDQPKIVTERAPILKSSLMKEDEEFKGEENREESVSMPFIEILEQPASNGLRFR